MSEIEHVGDVMRRSVMDANNPGQYAAAKKLEQIRLFLVSRAVSSTANQNPGLHLVRRQILEIINKETT